MRGDGIIYMNWKNVIKNRSQWIEKFEVGKVFCFLGVFWPVNIVWEIKGGVGSLAFILNNNDTHLPFQTIVSKISKTILKEVLV